MKSSHLVAYLLGDLSPDEERQVQAWIESAPGAREEVSATVQLLNDLDSLRNADARGLGSNEDSASLRAELARSVVAQMGTIARLGWHWWTLGVAASLLVGFFAGASWHARRGNEVALVVNSIKCLEVSENGSQDELCFFVIDGNSLRRFPQDQSDDRNHVPYLAFSAGQDTRVQGPCGFDNWTFIELWKNKLMAGKPKELYLVAARDLTPNPENGDKEQPRFMFTWTGVNEHGYEIVGAIRFRITDQGGVIETKAEPVDSLHTTRSGDQFQLVSASGSKYLVSATIQ